MTSLRVLSAGLLLIFLSGCSGKKPANISESDPPNIRRYKQPYTEVWKATLNTIEYEFLYPIDIQDLKRGFISTRWIRAENAIRKAKFQIIGTVVFNGVETMVKLYRNEEIFENGNWEAIPSDLVLEVRLLNQISHRLSAN